MVVELPLRWRTFWRLSWPIFVANMGAPLVGLTDTAVIGHHADGQALGAIALGALVFNLLYWSLGFLRMGTTAFTAQADGRGDEAEIRATLGRALVLGLGLGAFLVVARRPFADVVLDLLGGSEAVETLARGYLSWRIWGAPASLGLYALSGLLVGLGRSDGLLRLQVVLNVLNVLFDVLFVVVFDAGVEGIAIGSALAEWLAFVYAGVMVRRLLGRRPSGPWDWARILDGRAIREMLATNIDIMVRTILILAGFAWFTDQSARQGETVLAANHVLLQIVTLSAFFLDGYAHATETLIGRAVGRRDRHLFDRVIVLATTMAAVTAGVLAFLVLSLGEGLVRLLTGLEPVVTLAVGQIGPVAFYIASSFAAFELDGVFIGAARGRDLRNAAAISLLVFLVVGSWSEGRYGAVGLWYAMDAFVVVRALTLLALLPGLRHRFPG